MVRCPNCGSSNPAGSRVCSECGSALPPSESVRCPMCGFTNPPGTVQCQECGARVISLDHLPSSGASIEKGSNSAADVTAAEDIASTEVLADQMPLKEPSLPVSEREEQEGASAVRAARDVKNWLSDLRESASEDTYEPTREDDVNREITDLPEWLSGPDTSAPDVTFRGPAPGGEAVFDGLIPEDGELPDWLQEVQPPPQTTPGSAAPLQEQADVRQPSDISGETFSEYGSSSELETIPASAPASSDTQGSSLSMEESAGTLGAPANIEKSTGEEIVGEVPEWLREGAVQDDADQQSVIAQKRGERDVSATDTIPEWLRETAPQEEITTGADDAGPVALGKPNQATELPAWLTAAQAGVSGPSADASVQDLPLAERKGEAAALPGWLREIIPGESPDEAALSAGQVQVSEGATVPTGQSQQVDLESPVSQTGHERPPFGLVVPEAQRRPPSEKTPARTTPPSTDKGKVTGPAGTEVPDWLREMVASAQVEGSSSVAQEQTAGSAGAVHPASAARPIQQTEHMLPVDGPGVAAHDTAGRQPAIPDWLEALKPASDSPSVRVEEEQVETGGILDGLHGVLPAVPAEKILRREDLQATGGEPPEPSVARAQLLQALLARTPQMTGQSAASHQREKTGLWLQRMLVTVVMISAVVGALLLPLLIRPVPDLVSRTTTLPGADGAFDFIETLGPEDTILVAFEYGPAESDELNLLATAILRHLADRNVRVRTVSTRPEGLAMAATVLDFVSSAGQSGQSYEPGSYQPGGVVAVSDLLHSSVEEPAAVVVVTANPAVLRRWVEQTQLLDNDLPVVAGVSASLEPIIQPYFDGSTDRLVGEVGGLAGAAYYEQVLLGFDGQAARRLNALAAGHYAAIALIVAGAIVYGVGKTRRKTE